jgi:serpin B
VLRARLIEAHIVTKRSCVLVLSLTFLLTGCAGPWWIALPPPSPVSGPSPVPSAAATPQPTEPHATFGIQDLAVGTRNTSPSAPAADLRVLVDGNTAFAVDLYHRIAANSGSGNIALGPYSVSTALAMLEAGAAERTKAQIDDVLHFNLPLPRLDAALNALSLALASRNTRDVAVSVANRAFGQQGYPFRQSYLRRLTGSFDAPMAAVDYRNEWKLDRRLINQWVSDNTHHAINELIPDKQPPYITKNTRLALIDAMYLNAKWAHPFPEVFSHPQMFMRRDGSRIEVPMMETDISARYTQNETYQSVAVPYKGGQLSMLLVMPMDPKAFDAFERKVTPSVISTIESTMRRGKIAALIVPRFSTRTKVDLTGTLRQMGMTDAFERGVADFSGIAAPADITAMGEGPLFTTAVLHETWIKVGEKGTEAASATGAFVGEGGPLTILEFNHPFLWFIRDNETGTVLLLGRVMDPSQK